MSQEKSKVKPSSSGTKYLSSGNSFGALKDTITNVNNKHQQERYEKHGHGIGKDWLHHHHEHDIPEDEQIEKLKTIISQSSSIQFCI